jgi:hypothetical protein
MKALWLVSAFFLCASSAGAQTCKVLDPELATGTYTGACKDGLASGQGTVKPKAVAGVAPGAGASYVGDFVEGRKQGAGVKTATPTPARGNKISAAVLGFITTA